MKVVCISDTHNQHRKLKIPECDLLIHAGDFTNQGLRHKLLDFDEWCAELPLDADKIIVCAGNHELSLERDPSLAAHAFQNSTYLLDEGVDVDGLCIYASPWQPRFMDWAFNLDRGSAELGAKWGAIPEQIDVLVTHGPPFGIGDLNRDGEHVGCELLRERIEKVRPLLHVCGHIHGGYGQYETPFGTTVVNASSCDERYQPVNPPIVIELDRKR